MLVGGSIAAVAYAAGDDDGSASSGPPILTGDGVMDIQAILDKVQESVVTIETSGTTSNDVFEGAGTGIVLSGDGLVLTNAHVIAGSDQINVKMFDGAQHGASLVGSSPDDDLAVIQLEAASDLVAAELGSSEVLSVGDPVIAIGNALNLGGRPTVTQGIVSATNRNIEGPGPGGESVQLSNLIQTDAAINPGNSGGPLVDARGQVIGINTAIIAQSQNIGFAIAIDPVKPLIDDLRNGEGEITPDSPFLGVATINLDDIDEVVRRELGITADEGAFVSEVTADSAAEAAGLKAADVITAIDGDNVSSSSEVQDIISQHAAGDEIEVTIQREGEEQTITATLGRRGG
ncbi:MAG TPA: trypsin-like peptidase domain-containing protein [Acidimicrobiales bacterium]|jgi:putative serine protease PepD